MSDAFSIGEALRFGWHAVKNHSGLVFKVILTLFAFQIASSVVQRVLQDSALGVAASIALAVASIVLSAGMMVIFLKLARGESAHYGDLVPKAMLVWKYFAAGLLTGLISFIPVLIGGLLSMALLMATGSVNFSEGASAPGSAGFLAIAFVIMLIAVACAIYFGLRYSMARLSVLDGADIIDSIRTSAKLTHDVKWHLLVFGLALIALNILGAVCLLVGLLVTVPISLIAYAHVYLKLKARHGHH